MKSYFNAVVPGKTIGDGTARQLIDWLKQYIGLVFPENGIEYWGDNEPANPHRVSVGEQVPSATPCGIDESVHHVASYVRCGANEGLIIEVLFCLRNGAYKRLAFITEIISLLTILQNCYCHT